MVEVLVRYHKKQDGILKIGDNGECRYLSFIETFYYKLLKFQEPLDKECQKLLDDDMWELYIKDKPKKEEE